MSKLLGDLVSAICVYPPHLRGGDYEVLFEFKTVGLLNRFIYGKHRVASVIVHILSDKLSLGLSEVTWSETCESVDYKIKYAAIEAVRRHRLKEGKQ